MALRLSVSKTKTFLDCKRKYKYSYIQKLPKKDWQHLTFGKFCHKVLEDFHNAYIVQNSQASFHVEMKNAFKNGLQEFGHQMTPEMKKECWTIIDQYLRIITNDKKNNISANVLACEKNFELIVNENLVLNGMIDRIQMDSDNVIHVADYKTTKNKKYLKDDFFQLLTYAHVMLLENPDLEKIRASYILLRHNFEYITTEFTVDEIKTIEGKYIEYAEQMTNEVEFAPNPTMLCEYCDFSDVCEAAFKRFEASKVFGEVNW